MVLSASSDSVRASEGARVIWTASELVGEPVGIVNKAGQAARLFRMLMLRC
jgi:hypothetical protein